MMPSFLFDENARFVRGWTLQSRVVQAFLLDFVQMLFDEQRASLFRFFHNAAFMMDPEKFESTLQLIRRTGYCFLCNA